MTVSYKLFKNRVLVAIIVALFSLIEIVAPHGFIESHEKLEYEIEIVLPSSRMRLLSKIKSKLRRIKNRFHQILKQLHVLFKKIECTHETIRYIRMIQTHLTLFFQKYHFAIIGPLYHGDRYKSATLSAC